MNRWCSGRSSTNVLRRCKELGLHTALDTSGFLGMRATDELLDAVDLVLLDVKSGLPETYKTVTGRELAPTLRFGRRLRDRGTPIWIRYVLVPGLTDGEEDVNLVADYAASIRRGGAAGRGAAVPPDGPRQVEGPGHPLSAGAHEAAVGGARDPGARDLPVAGARHVLR